MKTKTLIGLLWTAMTATVFAGGRVGRVAISCNGNFHDRDDINSSGWELAIFAQAGRAQDIVYFGYADHYWETDVSMESDMSTSAPQAASD